MTSLYIARTPYHVILANGLALESEEPPSDQYLVGVLDSDMERLLASLRESDDVPFADVRELPGSYDCTPRRAQFRAKLNSVKVRRQVTRNGIDRIHTFHDNRPEDQAALDALNGNDSITDARGIYVEDGAIAYFYRNHEWTLLETAKMKLFYGPWRTNVSEHGTSKWIDEVRASFPEHVRPELRERATVPLPRREVLSLADRSWFRRYVEESGADDELDAIDGMIFVALSEDVSPDGEYAETVRSLVETFADRGHRVGIKYHPRETSPFLNLDGSDAVVLPQSIPAEVLYVADPDAIRFVVGNVSTSLLTARWLLDDVPVISLARILGTDLTRLVSVFEKLDVHVPDTRSKVMVPTL